MTAYHKWESKEFLPTNLDPSRIWRRGGNEILLPQDKFRIDCKNGYQILSEPEILIIHHHNDWAK